MRPLSPHDFETTFGHQQIIAKVHNLEQQVHRLDGQLHRCLDRIDHLEGELQNYR